MEICVFCEERPATHFNTEWDATLCDECADEQDELIKNAKLPKVFRDIIEDMKGE